MPPTADESGIGNLTTPTVTPSRPNTAQGHATQPRHQSSSHHLVRREASSYLPESARLRCLMVMSVALTCLGLLGPYMWRQMIVADTWQVAQIHWNAASILGREFVVVMVGLGVLQITAALGWGRGTPRADWLSLTVALSTVTMMVLGLAALLDIAIATSSVQPFSRKVHIVWTYFLAYPAATLAFGLSMVAGARRA